MKSTEMCIDENERLIQINRLPGENDIGMIAWKIDLMTPEYPHGREIIVVANDITHMIGSFSTSEDMLYYVSGSRFVFGPICLQSLTRRSENSLFACQNLSLSKEKFVYLVHRGSLITECFKRICSSLS